MSRRGEPKWVNHPVHGWLPDECPLFTDTRAGRPGISEHWDLVELVAYQGAWWPIDGVSVSAGYEGSWPKDADYLVPLTTAARELLAALRAEAGQ